MPNILSDRVRLKVTASMQLLAYLRAYHPSYPSVKALKRAIDQKKCKINGCIESFSTHPVRVGDLIELTLTTERPSAPMTLLYEDEELVAYNKPAFMVSEAPKGLFMVHRLDKETTGVILFAKTLAAQAKVLACFKERRVLKRYFAIVDGKVQKEKWTCDNFLGKKQSYQGGAVYGATKPTFGPAGGKHAITHFECILSNEEASLLVCLPKTGRTHQIRAHLKECGYPILGDWQYSQKFKSSYEPPRHLLHAHLLMIEGKEIIAPFPEDFSEAQEALFKASLGA